jgi:hypothetical protein
MDYCDTSNQIATYGGDCSCTTLNTRNVDVVTLDAFSVIADQLTIDGTPITPNYTSIIQKTSNQSATASPQVTTFVGDLTADNITSTILYTNNITAPSGTLNFLSPVTFSSALSAISPLTISLPGTGSIQGLTMLQAGQTSGGFNFLIGKAITTNNCLAVQYNSAGYGLIGLNAASVAMRLYPTYVDITGGVGLRVNNSPLLPRFLGTLAQFSTTPAGPFTQTWTTTGVQRIVASFSQIVMAGATATAYPTLTVGYFTTGVTSPTSYVGTTVGNFSSTQIVWSASGIPLWNNTAIPSPQASNPITGVIEFNALSPTSWCVNGNFVSVPLSGVQLNWVQTTGMITMPASTTINWLQLVKNTFNFTSGFWNVLYY